MEFRCYRDCDSLKLRKLVLELWNNGRLVDRRRMFAFWPRLDFRIERRRQVMESLGKVLIAASKAR